MSDKIICRNIVKKFGNVTAIDHLTVEIEPGSFTTLLGPSGCGKTTLLRIIAGLEDPTNGEISVGDKILYSSEQGINLQPKHRGVGLVFQSYALWPHMTVFENVAYGLKIKKMPKPEIQKKVIEVLRSVELEAFVERYPSELSGGQQQRVSMARMLAMEPQILLMDEPLSNLDAKLRLTMRAELKRIHNQLGITIIYVTHDQSEAMALSTHIVVLRNGKVQQFDTPRNIYRKSANLFVADFMGNPTTNLIEGQVVIDGSGSKRVRIFGEFDMEVPKDRVATLDKGKEVVIAIRPEDIIVQKKKETNAFPSRIFAALDSGPDRFIDLRKDDIHIVARESGDIDLEMNENVYVKFPIQAINLYDKKTQELVS